MIKFSFLINSIDVPLTYTLPPPPHLITWYDRVAERTVPESIDMRTGAREVRAHITYSETVTESVDCRAMVYKLIIFFLCPFTLVLGSLSPTGNVDGSRPILRRRNLTVETDRLSPPATLIPRTSPQNLFHSNSLGSLPLGESPSSPYMRGDFTPEKMALTPRRSFSSEESLPSLVETPEEDRTEVGLTVGEGPNRPNPVPLSSQRKPVLRRKSSMGSVLPASSDHSITDQLAALRIDSGTINFIAELDERRQERSSEDNERTDWSNLPSSLHCNKWCQL